jgi:hypothetical protein
MSKRIDGFGNDTEVTHDRPAKPSDPHGQPTQTRLLFDESVNTDTMCENAKERDSQEPKSKRPVLALPKGFKEASEYAVTGATERLNTLPQLLRALPTGPKRLEVPEIERVMSFISTV